MAMRTVPVRRGRTRCYLGPAVPEEWESAAGPGF